MAEQLSDNWDEPAESPAQMALFIDVEGFEGPLDLLLSLAREQKVDLRHISILALADQYISFVERVKELQIELAADYLVMAAWLAYLKSRLLLPQPEADGEPSPDEMAAALAYHLQRLQAMQDAGRHLMRQPLLGGDRLVRGAPEPLKIITRNTYDVSLYDLLEAYGAQYRRKTDTVLRIPPPNLYSMEEALQRLTTMLGGLPGDIESWTELSSFLPETLRGGLVGRSAIAATFAASLELARSGHAELRQDHAFGPIFLRARRH